jgi:hypothetical protein
VIHSVERHPQSHYISSEVSEVPSTLAPREACATAFEESPISERILSLVATLSERVKKLESKFVGVEGRKRYAPDEPPAEIPDSPGTSTLPQERPTKQARLHEAETSQAVSTVQITETVAENQSSLGQNTSDAEAEDAATVLEFLAWGRLKDSSLTSGVRDIPNSSEAVIYPDQDVIQATQAWGLSPDSVPGGQMSMKTMQMSQIQDMLPTKEQVCLLFQYHSDWLLFMHCSFHVETFRKELHRFYDDDHGIITMTSARLQWTALLFAIICGSITCAKLDQIANWDFHKGNLP